MKSIIVAGLAAVAVAGPIAKRAHPITVSLCGSQVVVMANDDYTLPTNTHTHNCDGIHSFFSAIIQHPSHTPTPAPNRIQVSQPFSNSAPLPTVLASDLLSAGKAVPTSKKPHWVVGPIGGGHRPVVLSPHHHATKSISNVPHEASHHDHPIHSTSTVSKDAETSKETIQSAQKTDQLNDRRLLALLPRPHRSSHPTQKGSSKPVDGNHSTTSSTKTATLSKRVYSTSVVPTTAYETASVTATHTSTAVTVIETVSVPTSPIATDTSTIIETVSTPTSQIATDTSTVIETVSTPISPTLSTSAESRTITISPTASITSTLTIPLPTNPPPTQAASINPLPASFSPLLINPLPTISPSNLLPTTTRALVDRAKGDGYEWVSPPVDIKRRNRICHKYGCKDGCWIITSQNSHFLTVDVKCGNEADAPMIPNPDWPKPYTMTSLLRADNPFPTKAINPHILPLTADMPNPLPTSSKMTVSYVVLPDPILKTTTLPTVTATETHITKLPPPIATPTHLQERAEHPRPTWKPRPANMDDHIPKDPWFCKKLGCKPGCHVHGPLSHHGFWEMYGMITCFDEPPPLDTFENPEKPSNKACRLLGCGENCAVYQNVNWIPGEEPLSCTNEQPKQGHSVRALSEAEIEMHLDGHHDDKDIHLDGHEDEDLFPSLPLHSRDIEYDDRDPNDPISKNETICKKFGCGHGCHIHRPKYFPYTVHPKITCWNEDPPKIPHPRTPFVTGKPTPTGLLPMFSPWLPKDPFGPAPEYTGVNPLPVVGHPLGTPVVGRDVKPTVTSGADGLITGTDEPMIETLPIPVDPETGIPLFLEDPKADQDAPGIATGIDPLKPNNSNKPSTSSTSSTSHATAPVPKPTHPDCRHAYFIRGSLHCMDTPIPVHDPPTKQTLVIRPSDDDPIVPPPYPGPPDTVPPTLLGGSVGTHHADTRGFHNAGDNIDLDSRGKPGHPSPGYHINSPPAYPGEADSLRLCLSLGCKHAFCHITNDPASMPSHSSPSDPSNPANPSTSQKNGLKCTDRAAGEIKPGEWPWTYRNGRFGLGLPEGTVPL